MPTIKRALISLSDKTGIVPFAKKLAELKVEILSTGGTAKLLRENQISVIEVGDYTGQPEILDGRLKTLHPKIHGGILGIRSNSKHLQEMKSSGIEPIDMMVVNLYPFEETVAKKGVDLETAIENIDIGGPTMIRAAAKNWQDVSVIVDPVDYEKVIQEIQATGGVSPQTNFELAKKVFILTSRYDGAIANYLTSLDAGHQKKDFPQVLNTQFVKAQDLRYGENPHQKASFYRDVKVGSEPCVSNAKQLHGKELSYNNILDLDAAFGLVREFETPACVIIKHTSPCGAAIAIRTGKAGCFTANSGENPDSPPNPHRENISEKYGVSLREIFVAARECDPLSAFGGIIAFNRPVDAETAREISKDFYECVIAPGFNDEAFQVLAAKKNIRLMETSAAVRAGSSPQNQEIQYEMRKVTGGLLVQEKDQSIDLIREGKVVTNRQPVDQEWLALDFAWKVVKHVKSNAIVYASIENGVIGAVGIGGGQVSRVDATRFGAQKSRKNLSGSVAASDAFFPFRDNIDEMAKSGVKAIIQPGGSVRDEECVTAANEHQMAMIFTGTRHFKH